MFRGIVSVVLLERMKVVPRLDTVAPLISTTSELFDHRTNSTPSPH
jgi:hypothetical protein